MTKKRAFQKNQLLLRLEIAALCLAVLLLGVYVVKQFRRAQDAQLQDELRQMFNEGRMAGKTGFSLFRTAAAEEERPISQRLAALYALNPDTVGWLEAGEDISNVVVKRDNEFYLTHDFYGKPSSNGTIFADVETLDCQNDALVILYGHNMRNGTMFGKLPKFEELDYFRENPIIRIYELYEDEVRPYVVFAAVDASMDSGDKAYFHLRRYQKLREGGEAAMQEYISDIENRSLFAVDGLDVLPQDRLLCLVTCTYRHENGRLLLFARALREGENMQEMMELVGKNAHKK